MLNSLSGCSRLGTTLKVRSIGLSIIILCAMLMAGCGLFNREDNEDDAPPPPVEELYAKAQAQLADSEWEDAIDTLQKIEAEYPYDEHATQAMIDTIYAYYRFGDIAMVKASADRFIKLHPTNESVAYAYYLKGLVSFREDKSLLGVFMGKDNLSDRDATNMLEALKAFRTAYEQFPDSEYAPASRKRAKEMEDALAEYEVDIAKFYFERDAYIAAVNRAERAIANYSSSPAIEGALGIMMQSYDRMGLPKLADDSRRVLELNYPESEYLE